MNAVSPSGSHASYGLAPTRCHTCDVERSAAMFAQQPEAAATAAASAQARVLKPGSASAPLDPLTAVEVVPADQAIASRASSIERGVMVSARGSKFWEAQVDGAVLIVRYGKVARGWLRVEPWSSSMLCIHARTDRRTSRRPHAPDTQVGTDGQSKTMQFGSEKEAVGQRRKRRREKEKKGYTF